MSETPQIAEELVGGLREFGFFIFDQDAESEIDGFYSSASGLDHEIHPLVVERGRALSRLHAAEFALIPAFEFPEKAALPPHGGPVHVGVASARLGLLKGDCSLIIWTHTVETDEEMPLRAADIAVFCGDLSKANRLEPEVSFDYADPLRLAAEIAAVHRESSWPVANQVAESGLLQLQAVLWSLKRSIGAPQPVESLRSAMEQLLPPLY